jgi:hypothetical protein
LIGLGATKAGTSWLYEYLCGHAECNFRGVKETHYFDAYWKGRTAKDADAMDAKADALIAKMEDSSQNVQSHIKSRAKAHRDLADILRQPEDTRRYLNYLCGGDEDSFVQGDITPAYALLPEEKLREMATMDDDVRFIYLLRDPVARLWSHVRMIATRRNDGVLKPGQADRILTRALKGKEPEITNRGDYKTVLAKLGRAIDPAKLKIIFSEEMFAGFGLTEICDFLGIYLKPGNVSNVVHGGQPLFMTEDQLSKAYDFLEEQYAYVAETMGRMPPAWHYNTAKV